MFSFQMVIYYLSCAKQKSSWSGFDERRVDRFQTYNISQFFTLFNTLFKTVHKIEKRPLHINQNFDFETVFCTLGMRFEPCKKLFG